MCGIFKSQNVKSLKEEIFKFRESVAGRGLLIYRVSRLKWPTPLFSKLIVEKNVSSKTVALFEEGHFTTITNLIEK